MSGHNGREKSKKKEWKQQYGFLLVFNIECGKPRIVIKYLGQGTENRKQNLYILEDK